MENTKPLDMPSKLPPLRIHHFLTWMAVAAVSFSLLLGIFNRLGFPLAAVPIQSLLPFLVQTLALTALGFTLSWYRQGHRLLEEPGQGLLLLVGLHFAWEMALDLCVAISPGINSRIQGPTEQLIRSLISWGGLVILLFNVLIWGFLYLRFLKVPGWRTYFLVMAILQLVALVVPRLFRMIRDVSPLLARLNAMLYLVPSWILDVTAVAGLAYLVIRDLRSSKRHHWSHWCGVVCALLVGIRNLNMSIMQMMVQNGWMP